MLDVQDFRTGDVVVRVLSDYLICVEGSMEKFINGIPTTFTFKRYYKLSKSMEKSAMMTEITEDGILVIAITDKMIIPDDNEENLMAVNEITRSESTHGGLMKSGSCTEFCLAHCGKAKATGGYSKHFFCPTRKTD